MFCIMLKEITLKELSNTPNVQLIDIREEYEHKDGHIKPSINIPMGELLEKLDQLDKSKQIVIYCNTARRSKPVVYMAYKLYGITLYNLKGGYKNFLKTSAK
jgi:rhodanese-related sulfurtransferase